MRSATMMVVLGAVLAFAAAGSTVALAQNKDQVIKDRQALMKQQGADMGAVKGFIDGNADQAKATAAATDLTQTMKKIPDVFPPGTDGPNPEGKYTTKPEIWSDWKGFLAARDAAEQKAEALVVAVKGGDKAKVQEAFASMGKDGCGGCHGKFRAEIKQ
jgi:cytochrome c556